MRWRAPKRGERTAVQQDEAAAYDEVVDRGGWLTGASTGAVALGVVALRRTAWVLLAAGPLLGGLALISQPSTASAPVKVVEKKGGQEQGPAGFAEMYVTAYLRAGEGSAQQLAPFFADAGRLQLSGSGLAGQIEHVAAVRVREVTAGRYWAVTVAVQVSTPAPKKTDATAVTGSANEVWQQRYFQVAVYTPVADSGQLVAAALPAEVAAPAAPQAPELGYGPARAASGSDPVVATLGAFFNAYLAGQGELGRYVSPGTTVAPVRPAPYQQVQVMQLAPRGAGSDAAELGAPQGRERLQLLVRVDAVRGDGVHRPLSYAIDLQGRDGRWEVAAVDSAPLLAAGAGTSTNTN